MANYVVIGLGKFGRSVARTLYRNGETVLAIDEKEELVQEVVDSHIVSDGIILDAENEKELKKIIKDNFDTAFVCIGTNLQSSILITLALKESGVKNIICKAKTVIQGKVLEKVGATEVVYPEKRMGESIALRAIAPDIIDYFKFSNEYGIFEIKSPESFIGKTLRELDLRNKYEVNVIGIKKGENNSTINPKPDSDIEKGTSLLLISEIEKVKKISEIS